MCIRVSRRGFLELGLISETVSHPDHRDGRRNISAIVADGVNCVYFIPSRDYCWINKDQSHATVRVPHEKFVVGLRFGLRYENDSMTLTVMEEARSYEPVVCGTINTTGLFESPPYFVLNMYGQVKATKLVSL